MSWLFGYKSQVPQQPDGQSGGGGGDSQPPTPGQMSGDQNLSKAERKAMEAYRFDSSALERAAEAAKTLERSSKLIQIQIFFFL